jgi:hypothetical protein
MDRMVKIGICYGENRITLSQMANIIEAQPPLLWLAPEPVLIDIGVTVSWYAAEIIPRNRRA